MAESERYRRGREKLEEIHGEHGREVVQALEDVAPELARYIFEFAFGDIYRREGLHLRDRQIATIAALTAQGNAQPQLKAHIRGGLNVGLTRSEIMEVIVQMAVYAGFPAAMNGAAAAREAFREADAGTEG
ncbi:carboxymuconolactone decarboxylase family protein [Thiohalorhabdus sp. Cl-TMA]|uniref:Carboxymuconolactone decarboxylase family protein n=1 Tax=Thiohalorhabdus methylotrophus TaxID=3242694 RepID=A0ABV4TXU0_9GAMM